MTSPVRTGLVVLSLLVSLASAGTTIVVLRSVPDEVEAYVAANAATLQGPQGATGQTGAQGVAGPRGPEGVRGEAGRTGPPGLQARRGHQGPRGLQGRRAGWITAPTTPVCRPRLYGGYNRRASLSVSS